MNDMSSDGWEWMLVGIVTMLAAVYAFGSWATNRANDRFDKCASMCEAEYPEDVPGCVIAFCKYSD